MHHPYDCFSFAVCKLKYHCMQVMQLNTIFVSARRNLSYKKVLKDYIAQSIYAG